MREESVSNTVVIDRAIVADINLLFIVLIASSGVISWLTNNVTYVFLSIFGQARSIDRWDC